MAKLTNHKTGETLDGTISEKLAGALQDAASESEEGACYAYCEEGTWYYVRPTERDWYEGKGFTVLAVF